MANKDNNLSINPPLQIFKDTQAADYAIPLSPQWLRENKTVGLSHSDVVNGEEETPDNLTKKDVFRPDRWRDEERDTLSTRSRNGDNNRWDNVGPRNFVEPRRAQNERWSDSGNKDVAGQEQRRESKWNSRWGPDGKETEITRSRLDEAGKDGEITRPWRPSQGRGRGEALHSQTTPDKQANFSAGRGRGSLFTRPSNKGESGHGEPPHVRYNRMKLLDVYRMAGKECYAKFPDGFIEVPSLTCDQPSDPLALCTPSSDELAVLDAIEKGKTVSSGAPQTSKEGLSEQNPAEFSQPRRIRPAGSREDMAYTAEESKEESGETRFYPDDKFRPEASHEEYAPFRKDNDVPVSMQGNNQASPWRPSAVGEKSSRISNDWNDPSADNRLKSSENVWSHPKDSINHSGGNLMSLPQSKGDSRWQTNEDPALRRQPSLVFDREWEVRKPIPSSPEELSLYYKDPQGLVQGPFTGTDIIGWFEAGYFGIDLLVRLASAPNDSPFSLLGDVMPHLQANLGAPPCFSGAKPSEFDVAGTPALSAVGKVHYEGDILQNDMRYKHVGGTVAENRFIESWMSGSLNNSSQGIQGYSINSSGGVSLAVNDGGADMYLLAKKLELERQRSVVPSPYPYWPGRESGNLMPGSENVLENAQLHGRSPSADLMSILQGVTDRSTPAVSTLPSWPHSNQPPFGVQQQRLPEQISSLAGLLGQPIENNSGGIFSPDMMVAPGLAQDQQSLNLLQQQQLLMQLNAQGPLSAQQQRLVLEKMLLLKQQQKQEEQQQLLRQQQHQLFSQVLADQQRSQQRFREPSFGQLQPSFDALRLQPLKDMTQINQQIQVPVSHEERGSNLSDLLQGHVTNQNVATLRTHSPHLLNQLFGNVDPRMNQGTVLVDQTNGTHKKETISMYERRNSAGDANN